MNRHDLTVIGALAAGSLVAPLLLAALADWPQWTVLPLALLGLLATLVWGSTIRSRRRAERLRVQAAAAARPAPSAPPTGEVTGETTLREVPVPSAESDYPFLLSATVKWARAAGSAGMRVPGEIDALADALLTRARAVTTAHRPTYLHLARHAVGAEFGIRRTAASGEFDAWAEDVVVTVRAEDEQRLRALTDVRKDREVWEQRRELEIVQREYLRRDALRSPATAVLWQLAKDPDKIAETVALIGALTTLSAAVHDDEPPARRAAVSGPWTTARPTTPGARPADSPADSPAAPTAAATGRKPGEPAPSAEPLPAVELSGESPVGSAGGNGSGHLRNS